MNRIVNFFKAILAANGGISSKRFCGVLGWVIILGVYIYCTVTRIQAPDMTEELIFVSASLLGMGVFEDYFKNKRH